MRAFLKKAQKSTKPSTHRRICHIVSLFPLKKAKLTKTSAKQVIVSPDHSQKAQKRPSRINYLRCMLMAQGSSSKDNRILIQYKKRAMNLVLYQRKPSKTSSSKILRFIPMLVWTRLLTSSKHRKMSQVYVNLMFYFG